MLKKYVLSGACAVVLAGAVASAQSTTSGQQQPPSQPQPQSMQHEMTTTVEGCVYREQDIPGRAPNVAERAGVLEDYILVASTDASATAGATGTSGSSAAGTAGTAGSATAAKMYKLEHADDSKLSALVGKRVRVTGKADMEHGDKAATGAAQTDRTPGNPDKIELPEFEVTSITETTGTCPAKPADKK
jgi:hypothetical protein